MRATLVAVFAALLTVPAQAQSPAQTPPAYKVITEEKNDTNRTVDVRVERRLEEADVSAITNAIVNRDAKSYARTVVNFLLPTTRTGEAPWASATVIRDTRVKIPGLRLDEEKLFTAEARADQREAIGAWLTSTPATPGRITIYRDDGRIFVEWRLRGGTRTVDEVRETRMSGGRRFDIRSGTGDDYFVINGSGDLELRAKGALTAIAERIREPHVQPPAAVATPRARGNETERWPLTAADAPRLNNPGAAGNPMATGSVAPAAALDGATPAPPKAAAPARQPPRRPAQPPASPPVDLSTYLRPSG